MKILIIQKIEKYRSFQNLQLNHFYVSIIDLKILNKDYNFYKGIQFINALYYLFNINFTFIN